MNREQMENEILKALCADLKLLKTIRQLGITVQDFTDSNCKQVFNICEENQKHGKLTLEMFSRFTENKNIAKQLHQTFAISDDKEVINNFMLHVTDMVEQKFKSQRDLLLKEYADNRKNAKDTKKIDMQFAQKILALKDPKIVFENTSAEEIIDAHYRQDKRKKAVPTFLRELDEHSKFYRGEPNVIAAGSGVGKTTTMMNCASKAAEAGYKVLVLSQEMHPMNLVFKALAIISEKEEFFWRLENRLDDSPDQFQTVKAQAQQLLRQFFSGRLIIEGNILSAERLCQRIEHAEEQGIDIVFYDYFQLCKAEKPKANGDFERYAEVSDMIRQCVKDKNLSFVWLSQITPDLKDPGNSKMKNTSTLKDNSASVIILYKKKSDRILPNVHPNIYAYINKNRYGLKDIEIAFPFDYTRQRISNYQFSSLNLYARSRILSNMPIDLFAQSTIIHIPSFENDKHNVNDETYEELIDNVQ
ncbi:hypothetical protein BK120_19770 [Paenibacillus sp. FSL A5-0031]|uniref:DnaB-like helicase C-terminal domain-containing protein n=1 Tax=Paenibacillus sp. FSL A5-0031 TaxID=1920420 RepID=UPI00096E0D85|nr:DnaB-like helicase C-terminal domain-containing protein [Paenibacillus sp. FSL A5-0031]OME80081.1 hypothetical protein BK120_19770 [Paenibacillus sp. FSL A5-0031]